jgi:hypothetical protein
MIVNSPRIFGKKDKFFTVKSKVLKRKKNSGPHSFINTPLGIILVLVFISAALLGGRYIFDTLFMKERFIVEEIIVEGNNFVQKDTIESAAGVQIGADLIQFDSYAAKLRIEKIPQILSARIRKKLPTSAIIITVVERSARAIIKSPKNGETICVDADGILLPEKASGGLDDITVINGIELTGLKPGQYCDDRNLHMALEILHLHDVSKLKEQVNVEAVTVTPEGEIRLHEREKKPARRLYTVHLGNEDFAQRLANLSEIFEIELQRNDRLDRIINLTYERPLSVPVNAQGP